MPDVKVDPENRMLTKGQIEILALAIFSNSGPNERPGRMSGNVWKFYDWSEMNEAHREPFMRKAIHAYATLCAYGMRLVSLDG